MSKPDPEFSTLLRRLIAGDHLDAAALRRSAAQPALGAADAVLVAMWQTTRDALSQGALGDLVGTGFGAAAILVAGYGSLALSHYPGLRSVGYITTFGIGISALAALTLLPAILVQLARIGAHRS